MALRWDISEVENNEELKYSPNPDVPEEERVTRLKPFTDSVIWATMHVGIPEITKENFEQFYGRMKFVEATNGTMYQKWDFEKEEWAPEYTVDDVERHIGLSTNASKLTRTAFIKQNMETFERRFGKL